MSKGIIQLIIKREYLSRVRRKSFILMSLLGPVIMAAVIIGAFWFSLEESEDQKILVVDDNYPYFSQLSGGESLVLDVQDISLVKAEALLEASDYTALLYLPKNIVQSKTCQLIFKKQPSFRVQRQLEEKIQQYLEISKLKEFDISESDYRRLKAPVVIAAFQFQGAGKEAEASSMLPAVVGQAFGIVIFLFIFMYSVLVMRGVIEEKTGRVVEVLISSVKPFQLMMGKIIGVGAVGLTQFVIWIVLTFSLAALGQAMIIGDKYMAGNQSESTMTKEVKTAFEQEQRLNLTRISADDNLFNQLGRINYVVMLSVFLFYFIGGYLLYSALMAAIGSAVDNDTDTQQFVLPVTFPLLLAYMLSFTVFTNPSGTLAVWLSIIPFTSPVIMMVRVAAGIAPGDMWQVYLSMALLVLSFVATVWLSAKIYRTGILLYGKKAGLREIYKWIKQ